MWHSLFEPSQSHKAKLTEPISNATVTAVQSVRSELQSTKCLVNKTVTG